MTTVIKSSDLDFDTIKSNLKTHLQSAGEFSDYDFEASGISNILDVLAYNTHLNGLIANFAINESFLSSSQLRSSVVSHAESLGYYSDSMSGSFSDIRLSVSASDSLTTSITLPSYTSFTGTIGEETFTFYTIKPYTARKDNDGNFVFKDDDGLLDLTIVEGRRKIKTFLVGEVNDNQVYVIPDVKLDKSTLKSRCI